MVQLILPFFIIISPKMISYPRRISSQNKCANHQIMGVSLQYEVLCHDGLPGSDVHYDTRTQKTLCLLSQREEDPGLVPLQSRLHGNSIFWSVLSVPCQTDWKYMFKIYNRNSTASSEN